MIFSTQAITRIDFRVIPIIFSLMIVSLLVIAANTYDTGTEGNEAITFFTPLVRTQIRWFFIGSVVFLFFAGFDYNKLREWTWILYILMILSLVGLFFTDPIQRVHRWYKIPFIGSSFQPSEYAKLIVVMALSWFLERHKSDADSPKTALMSGLIALIPFILILKQPDLGTALVLFPITLVIFYFGGINSWVIRAMSIMGGMALIAVALIFLEIVPHETLRPYAMKVLKSYQFDRLDPHTHHQKAAVMAIGIGGITGTGWRKSEFTGGGFLPAPFTDSVFPAFGEEFGFVGCVFLLGLFYSLIYCSFQVSAVAKDSFGRYLAAGITVYLAMHILINIGMMCGVLPITGVPLVLVTYGGSSVLSTMTALGILQSVYSRRFMF